MRNNPAQRRGGRKMANVSVVKFSLWTLFLAISISSFIVTANINEETNKKIFEKLLQHLNEENNSKYRYESAKIVETHFLNGATHFLTDINTVCHDLEDSACVPLAVVCQGILESPSQPDVDPEFSKIKCFLKENHSSLPSVSQGYIAKRSNKFIETILDHGLQKLARDGGQQRRMIEILSVKKRETSSTEVFITAKVAAGSEESGDVLELEMCELAATLGAPGSMQILDTETKCFPLLEDIEMDHLGGTLMTPEELSSLAGWTVGKMNMATENVFNFTLMDMMKADASVTPGSGGVVTTMQLRLAPSACPKQSIDLGVDWQCSPSGQPMICTVATWQRPWRGDTLISRPKCKRIPVPAPARVVRHTGSEDSSQRQPGFCTGCVDEVNKENPKVTELATEAVLKLNAGQLSSTPHQLIRVLSAHRQVINGIRYILNVELAACLPEKSPCEVAEGSPSSLRCRIEIIEGAVDQQRTITSSHCNSADQPEDATTTSEASVGTEETRQVEETPSGTNDEQSQSSGQDGQQEQEMQKDDAGQQTTQRRSKRSNKSLGAPEPMDLKKEGPLIRELADLALNTIDDIDDDMSRRRLLEIVEAKKQVVNGYTYQLTLRVGVMPPCAAGEQCLEIGQLPSLKCKVWVHRSPANQSEPQQTRVMRSECEPEGTVEIQEAAVRPNSPSTQQPAASGRQRRNIRGGLRTVSVNDDYVKEMARFALSELDRGSGSPNSRLLTRIVSAKKQVVAGTMTHLVLELVYSNCSKEVTADQSCTQQAEQDGETCYVAVWDRPWLQEKQVHNFTCKPTQTQRQKRPEVGRYCKQSRKKLPSKDILVGNPRPANLSDPFIHEIAHFSLTELDRGSNALYTRKVVKILKAETQVVSGILTHLTYEVGYSNCSKEFSEGNICTLQEEVDHELCTVEVWDRPWLKERTVTNSSCNSVAKDRKKRSVPLLGRGSHDMHIGVFREFVAQHNKQYSSEEEFHRRFHIFRANLHKIKTLQDTEQGTARYGLTQFADLTATEFKQQYLGLKHDLKEKGKMKMKKAVVPNIQLPPEFDWRHYNIVTPVKNQGACGSCWAFSVTGNVEGQWALRRGQLLSLSEQELVDCDSLDNGCNGGLPSNAYEAIQKLGGLESESDYPYEGRGEKCHFEKSEVRATVTGGLNITTNETQMAQWLVKNGPISIGINANAMQFYFGGVSHPWKMLCNPNDLDHGVLIVGYGVHTYPLFNKTLPYWTIKNSWGPSWGEQGYYRVYRGDGTCGVNQMATSAIVG